MGSVLVCIWQWCRKMVSSTGAPRTFVPPPKKRPGFSVRAYNWASEASPLPAMLLLDYMYGSLHTRSIYAPRVFIAH